MNTSLIDSAPRAREPGMWRADPYLERYRVRGGGAAIVSLREGDELTVVDPEGRQIAEVVPFDSGGKPDPTSLTEARTKAAEGLQTALGVGDSSALDKAVAEANACISKGV